MDVLLSAGMKGTGRMIIKASALGVVSLLAVAAMTYAAQPHRPDSAVPEAASQTPRLPARHLDCRLGRIANFNPSIEQKPEDYRYDGNHAFRLLLPAIPVRTGPPPLATQAPDPVDPRTRIVADPDQLAHGADRLPFYRVVDDWPERVEMTTPITAESSNLVILDRFDPVAATVNVFMTVARDAVTYDQQHLYAGRCTVTLEPVPRHD